MKIARSTALALALVTFGTVQPSSAADPTAANGTWKLDIAKSDFGKETPPKSVRLIIAGTSTSMTWSQKTVLPDGKSQKVSYKGAVGDRFYPIEGDPDGNTFAYMKDGSFAIKDKSGKVVLTTTWSLSADGQTMTQHQIFHTAAGDETHTIILRKAK